MDYKEEYEAMVKRCRELHESGNALTKQQMEIVCPQLKESEDERIRKELVEYFSRTGCNFIRGIPIERIMAYLEKQKDIDCLACDQHLKGYIAGRKVTEEEKQKEQQPAEWSKEDERKIVELKTFIAQCNGFNKENRKKAFDMIDALCPQPHWKPSEEQMKALERAEDYLIESDNEDAEIIGNLYNDLSKL